MSGARSSVCSCTRTVLRFDAIFAWNLFDYLDASTARAVTGRIGRHCRTGTLLYLTTSNGDTIPDEPGRFAIVDELHLRFQHVGMGTRSGMKHSPRGLNGSCPDSISSIRSCSETALQDYLFSHGLSTPPARRAAGRHGGRRTGSTS